MLELITRFVQPVVRIKRGEWRKTILMFFYFAFTIATLYILKPVRSSLFLSTHGAENLRYAYVGEGLFLILITFLYVKLSKRIARKNILFSVVTAFFASNVLVFWVLFKLGLVEWLAYLFYIWVAAYSITGVTQCWTLANDIFNPQEAKRLFGFIVSGASFGGIIGGLVTNRFAQRVGTENLLLFAAFSLCLCIVFINEIWKHEYVPSAQTGKSERAVPSVHLREKSTWKLLFSSRYLLLIVALVMIAKIASTIVDNQFNSMVENTILEKHARTAFFGGFMAFLNGVSFFMQLILASYALRYLGIGISLLLLPIGLCFGSAATLFFPILGIAAANKIYDGSLNYSINQLSKEILYLPIPSYIRYRIKPVIDMLAYRASKTVAGFLIILITPLLGISDQKLGLLVLLLVPFWILAAWGVRDEYMQSIKKLLSRTKGSGKASRSRVTTRQAAAVLANLKGERSFDQLKEFLDHKSSVTRKMSAAACLAFYSSARDVERVKKLVGEIIRYEALELKNVDIDRLLQESMAHENGFFDRRFLNLLKAKQDPNVDLKTFLRQQEKEVLLKVSECLNNPREEMSAKRKAVLILTTLGTQGTVDILLNSLASVDDRSLRFNLIRALNQIRARGESREFNSWIIKKEVMSEIKSYKSIVTILEEYKKCQSILRPEEDYLLATLQAIREESLERIFRLLALLYDSDIIHVIYDRLVELNSDKHVKANALELLENVLEPELCRALCPLFDESQWERMQKKDLDEVVGEFLESRDRWLIVCAIFLIVELHLERFYSRLEDVVHSQVPIVREAAEIALLKTKQ